MKKGRSIIQVFTEQKIWIDEFCINIEKYKLILLTENWARYFTGSGVCVCLLRFSDPMNPFKKLEKLQNLKENLNNFSRIY